MREHWRMRLPSPRILRAFNRRSVIALSAFALAVAGVSVTASADANANSGVVTTMVVHVPGVLPISAQVVATGVAGSNAVTTSTAVGQDDYGWFAQVGVPTGATSARFAATGTPSAAVNADLSTAAEWWLDPTGVPYPSRSGALGYYRIHVVTSSIGTVKVRVTDGNSITDLSTVSESGGYMADGNVGPNTSAVQVQYVIDGVAGVAYTLNVRRFQQAWISDTWPEMRTSKAWADGFVIIHYRRGAGDYTGWGLHTWAEHSLGAAESTLWSTPLMPDPSLRDAWGVTWKVPLLPNSTQLPFIIHNGNDKDPSYINQFLDIATTGGEVWVLSGAKNADLTFVVQVPIAFGSTAVAPTGPTLAQGAALATPSIRSAMARDRVYFVMTDRYANADKTNDTGRISTDPVLQPKLEDGSPNPDYDKALAAKYGAQGYDPANPGFDKYTNGFDPTDAAYYHGGDLKGLTFGEPDPKTKKVATTCTTGTGLARIKALGFTSVWLTPPFVQEYVQGGSAAYHGYWINDFTKIDPHLGTNADFRTFVNCAHQLNMKVIMDIVVNHTGDVIHYEEGSKYTSFANQQYYDISGRQVSIAQMMTGQIDPQIEAGYGGGFPKSAFTYDSEATIKAPAFLNDLSNYHNRGDVSDWSNKEQYQFGDFSGLDDVFTERASVVQGFADVYSAWVKDYGVDGFRIDTAKHVDDAFFGRWWPKVKAQTAATKPGLYAFGEVYETNPFVTSKFVRDRALPSVLDFPFQSTIINYAAQNAEGAQVASLLDWDDEYTTASTNAYGLTTFLDNHDMGRLGLLLGNKGVYGSASLLKSALFSYDLLYLLRGIPVVYYGDEVGMIGSGGDKLARQDMFATSTDTPSWPTEERMGSAAIGTKSSLQIKSGPFITKLTKLAALRDKYPTLASGAQIPRFSDSDTLVISRIDAAKRTEYIVGFNNNDKADIRTIQTSSPLTTFKGIWNTTSSVKSDKNGLLKISIGALSSVVLQAQSPLPAAPTPTITLSLPWDGNAKVWRATAAVPGRDPSTVTFMWRQTGTAAWQVLGSDDAYPYRVDADPTDFTSGARIEVAAVVKTTSGGTAVSKALTFVAP